MSEQPSSPAPSGLSNPQILAAVITAITTIAVALISIVPNIVNSNQTPTPTQTPIIITATPLPPTSAPTQVSAQPTAELTILPSDLPILAVEPTSPPAPITINQPSNVRIIYDGVALSLLNMSSDTLSLENVSFRSSAGTWEARNWGPSLHDRIPDGQCVRLRDRSAGQRQPPPPCVNKIFSLIEVGSTALFWVNVASFEVVRNDEVIATCEIEAAECAFYIPPS